MMHDFSNKHLYLL